MAYNPSGGYGGGNPQQSHQQWYGGQQQAQYGAAGGHGPGQPGYYPPYGNAPQPSLTEMFMRADTNGDGRISHAELQGILGPSLFNAETCRLILGMFDRDRDGCINMDEFQGLWQYIDQWKQCFMTFDKDCSGTIDANELCQAFHQFGYRLSMNFCQNLIRRFDRTSARSVRFDDFIQCCVMLKCFTEGFKARDTQRKGEVYVDYIEFLDMAMTHAPV